MSSEYRTGTARQLRRSDDHAVVYVELVSLGQRKAADVGVLRDGDYGA